MKRLLLIWLLALPLVMRAQNINIQYDYFWQDQNFDWVAEGTSFMNFQGTLFSFVYQKYTVKYGCPNTIAGWPTVYIQDLNTGKLVPYLFGTYHSNSFAFGYSGESTSTDAPQLLGNVILFQFNARLWYFQQVNPKLYPAVGPRIKDNYECFQQMPTNTASDGLRYYSHYPDWPDIVKCGAFQADSNTLVFIGHNTNESSAYYLKWYLWVYSYNPKNGIFTRGNYYILEGAMGAKYGGVVKHMDKSGKAWYVLNTCFPDTYLGYLRPNPNPGCPYTYQPEPRIPILQNYGTTTIIAGSLKGGRSISSVMSPQNPCRFALFGISNSKSSDGNYHMSYRDLYIKSGSMYLGSQGDVVLPAASYPNQVDKNFYLQGAYELDVADFSNVIYGPDGLQQNIWIFYPDKKQQLNGARFVSDKWRPVDPDVISSFDLMDTTYPGIRNLWSLTGIVDGAPPCSVNWPLWIESHSAETEPTELNFTTEQESETEITSSYEDKYTLGEEINLGYEGEEFGASMNEEFQYSNSFKQLHSSGTTVSTSYSNAFGLDEEFQENGFFIWSVPQIKRFTYVKYPWWDDHCVYPDSSSLQFLFRVLGMTIVTEKRKLSDFPFYVENPNDSTLINWTAGKRVALATSVTGYGMSPILNLQWTDGAHGSKGTYAIAGDSVTTYESANSYEAKVGVTVKIPEIFEATLTYGQEVNYSNETTVKTRFGQEIEASLSNLTSKSKGPNISQLQISTYWLRNEDRVKWWFYDELGDQRPWYIAYLVDYVSEGKIIPLTPENGQNLKASAMLFAWQAEKIEPDKYTFFITTLARVTPSSVVYQRETGNNTGISITDFTPVPGTTYYWIVKATLGNDIFWSQPRSFTIPFENPALNESGDLKVNLYPNPAFGSDVHVVLALEETARVRISLYEISGSIIFQKEMDYSSPVPATFSIPARGLKPGMYFVGIQSQSGSTLRKLIIGDR